MKKKLLVRGPALSRSGYGEQTRFALRALRSQEEKFDIFIENMPWGKTGHITEDNEEKNWIDETLLKTAQHKDQKGTYDVSLQVTIPNEWKKLNGIPINIGYTAGIETTRVAPTWLSIGNEMNNIIVVSEHSRQVYETTTAEATNASTGQVISNYACTTPIDVVNYAVREFDPEPLDDVTLDYDFNYLAVAQFGPRKNITNTIKWFVEEFRNEEVGLILKTNIMKDSLVDREHTTHALRSILQSYPERKCKIYLLHGTLSDGNMAWLYQHPKIKAMISLSHGEGFGLPLFEAAYNGLPLITTNWSGQADFINMPDKNGKVKPHIAKVKYHLNTIQKEAVWRGVLEPDSMWAYPAENSARVAMRDVFKNVGRFKSQAKRLQKWIKKNFSEEQQYAAFCDSVIKEWKVDYSDALNEAVSSTLI